jgi:hypothetical protein
MTKTIAIDFDGVLADYHGWEGPEHLGAPLPGALAFIHDLLASDYQVVIFTTRADSLAGREMIRLWFMTQKVCEHCLAKLELTNIKPPAWLYIDDRCFLFKGTYPTIKEIEDFKPWWKQ